MSSARILVVEDNRVVARDIRDQLTRIGHLVVGTTTIGAGVLALAAEARAELVLMDIHLEGDVDGIEAGRQLRERLQIPVIYLTAYADDRTLRRASETEPFGYLLKPFEDSHLRTAIEIALYKHQSERRLRVSERRHALTLSSIADAVIVTDERGDITLHNAAAERLTGISSANAIGKPLSQVFRASDEASRAPLEYPAASTLGSGERVVLGAPALLVSADGDARPVDESASAIIDAGGNVAGLVVVFRDITQRRQAAKADALQEANARIELALSGSNIAFFELEMPGGTLENARVRSINWREPLGHGPLADGDDEPSRMLDLVHPDDRAAVKGAFAACIAGAGALKVEARARHADGAYRWRMARGVLVRDAGGRPLRCLGCILDVDAEKRTQEALRASEARYRGTFENAGVGIAHCDLQGRALWFNDKCSEIVGYPRHELQGRSIRDVTHSDDVEESTASFQELVHGELASLSEEKRYVTRDGRTVWAHLTVSFQRDAAGAPLHSIAVIQDISPRKQLEVELRQAKDVAEAANRAKDTFLANVSHEIRTPMNAILGMTELVLDTRLDGSQRESLRTVLSAASSLLGIIDDLLDFSKIEAGKLELDVGEFGLRAALGDALNALAVRAHRKGLDVVCDVRSDVPDLLFGDAARLRQVLLNLVGNAIKFTEKGEVIVGVAVSGTSAPEGEIMLSFSVKDTGVGIPQGKQKAIFRAFEQEDTSTTRKYGGSGLGLTIAARLVALMGGEVSVVSEPNRGSTFTFTARFGARRPPDQPTIPGTGDGDSAPPRLPMPPAPGASLRILVAEDNEFNSQLLLLLLTKRGHRVEIVNNGRAALSRAQESVFDLMLLDLHMPEMDGIQVIQAIRERERTHGGHLPVIALTARSRSEDRESCLAAGMDEFLTKPITAAGLWLTVERLAIRPE